MAGSPPGSVRERLLQGAAGRSDDVEYGSPGELGATQKPVFDLVLVHPAEGVAPRSMAQGCFAACCSAAVTGTPEPAETLARRRALHARMRCLGLALSFDLSRDADEVLIKVKAPEEMLEEMAERLTMEKKLAKGDGLYADFTRKGRSKFYVELDAQGQRSTLFTSLERIKLLLALIEMDKHEGGCGINLDGEVAAGVLTAVVPMHEPRVVNRLVNSWLSGMSLFPAQPVDEIRDYLGEELGFYFAFAGHLTRALIWPMLAGFGVLAGSYHYGSLDNPLCPAYSAFVLLWMTWFIKSWSREQSRLAYRWNVEDFEETERARHEFEGPLARGFYTDEGHWVAIDDAEPHASSVPLAKKFTTTERSVRVFCSWTIIMPLIVGVMAGSFGVLAFRSSLQVALFYTEHLDLGQLHMDHLGDRRWWHDYAPSIGSGIGGALNALFIVLMNYLYAYVAEYLNQFENHRTPTDDQDALIMKTFVFQFINSYIALFYIAFVKALSINFLHIEGGEYCHDLMRFNTPAATLLEEGGGVNGYCMDELGSYLSFVLTFSRVLSIFIEWAFPAAMRAINTWIEEATLRVSLRNAVAEANGDVRALQRSAPWAIGFAKRALGGKTSAADMSYAMRSTPLPRMSPYEEQAKLEPHEGVFSEYSSLIINLGYVVLFAPAFPIAAAICYLTFLFELKTDAYKCLVNVRRARGRGAEDIGSWINVLHVLCTVSVVTNMALIAFTSTQFQQWLPFTVLGVWEITPSNKTTFLFVVEHFVLGAQYFVAKVLPDMPEGVAVERSLSKWRAKATTSVLNGTPPTLDEVWDDRKIPRKFFGTLNGAPLPKEAPAEPTVSLKDAPSLKSGNPRSTDLSA